MLSYQLLTALVAASAGLVSAQSTCTEDIMITEPTQVISCKVIDANVSVDKKVVGAISIEGPEQIKGDFVVQDAKKLLSISSSSINAIGGKFDLENLELLNMLSMPSLESINEIALINLQQLNTVTFASSGVTKANKIQVSDTFLGEFVGFNLTTVAFLQIDNNPKMTSLKVDLVNITDSLIVIKNGNNMQIEMPSLEGAAEIQLSNVKSFGAPLLSTVSASIKFDNNPELESFEATNLTEIAESLTFINNNKLTNVSFPSLTKINGDLTVVNNTDFTQLEGLPELKSVYGGIQLGGTFEKVELPALKDVKGSVEVSSTTDISDFCTFFDNAKDDGSIRGKESCTSNNSKANEGDTEGGTSGKGSKDSDNAAGIVSFNMALLGLAAVATIAQFM